MTEIKKNYKDKMKVLMPEQFSEETKDKTLVERIEEKMKKAQKEHSNNRDTSISQFWYGQWRAMEWVLTEMKKGDNVL
jgi:hypothetical protein